jgi:hypothetical protein
LAAAATEPSIPNLPGKLLPFPRSGRGKTALVDHSEGGGIVSEQGDQWEDRDQEQHGGSSSSEQGGSSSKSGGQDRQQGTEQGNRESGTGTDSSQAREEDDQSRQGDVKHEGDLGNTRAQQ